MNGSTSHQFSSATVRPRPCSTAAAAIPAATAGPFRWERCPWNQGPDSHSGAGGLVELAAIRSGLVDQAATRRARVGGIHGPDSHPRPAGCATLAPMTIRQRFNLYAWDAARGIQAMNADKGSRPPERLLKAIEGGLTLNEGDGRPLFELLKKVLIDKE